MDGVYAGHLSRGSSDHDVCCRRATRAPVYVGTNHGETFLRTINPAPGLNPTWKSREGAGWGLAEGLLHNKREVSA